MKTMLVIVPMLLVVVGLVSVASPKLVWYLQGGWKYKNAQPSDAVLVMHRLTGMFTIAAGIGIWLYSDEILSRLFLRR